MTDQTLQETNFSAHLKLLEQQQLELRASLEATGLCHVLAIQTRGGCVQVAFSVLEGKESQWEELLAKVLPDMEHLPFHTFVGEKYSVANGRLVAAWLLRIDTQDAESLKPAIDGVRKAFMRVANPAVDDPRPVDHSWFRELMFEDRRRGNENLGSETIASSQVIEKDQDLVAEEIG